VTASPSFDGKAGPWGLFEYTPIQIAPPADLIKVNGDIAPSRWFFRGLVRRQVEQLFQDIGTAIVDSPSELEIHVPVATAGVAVSGTVLRETRAERSLNIV
jgi:hypothetical protein